MIAFENRPARVFQHLAQPLQVHAIPGLARIRCKARRRPTAVDVQEPSDITESTTAFHLLVARIARLASTRASTARPGLEALAAAAFAATLACAFRGRIGWTSAEAIVLILNGVGHCQPMMRIRYPCSPL